MGKPTWLRVKAPQRERIGTISDLLTDLRLNTVCEEASCPNIGECFAGGTATFLIMGPGCTRACPYCNIDFDKSLRNIDPTEASRLGEAVVRMNLKHVVITSVNRDDLVDGGAHHFVECINNIRARSSKTTIEVLIPDLCGDWDSLKLIIDARPEVINHNIETVPRLYKYIRPQGTYIRSLDLLKQISIYNPQIYIKSGLMVGLGELDSEVIEVMSDLKTNKVDIITIGQYLSPSIKHLPIHRFVSPDEFNNYKEIGENKLGFLQVISTPLTRSSYHAGEIRQLMKKHCR